MNIELERKIAEEFSWMLPRDDTNQDPKFIDDLYAAFGIECGDGWYEVIRGLCRDITDAYEQAGLPVDVQIFQIKEKYGTLRFYQSCCKEMYDIVEDLISKWEDVSEVTCEVCGKPGVIYDKGWVMVRCEECRAAR